MARGQRPLDADVKAERRQASLRLYASKNREKLRLAARERMEALRAFNSGIVVSQGQVPKHRLRARATDAKYRDSHREQIQAANKLCRETSTAQKPSTNNCSARNWQGLRSATKDRRALLESLEEPTENQQWCRALRKMGLEEDNGDDSDEDLPEHVCGCDLSECQRPLRNETERRKSWKRFHLKYDEDGNLR
ncbi:hypothetical protein B0H16DRAFT_1480647 [Mycena metata]|uniref:Uncharacterized protein n=1 Tax=Mycena metata TaxID=1033252 RepID=A0AAD7H3N3_9AGAR|nr:hypothetical protein B0H16DRAFT_1480647 [Mycena metata]